MSCLSELHLAHVVMAKSSRFWIQTTSKRTHNRFKMCRQLDDRFMLTAFLKPTRTDLPSCVVMTAGTLCLISTFAYAKYIILFAMGRVFTKHDFTEVYELTTCPLSSASRAAYQRELGPPLCHPEFFNNDLNSKIVQQRESSC